MTIGIGFSVLLLNIKGLEQYITQLESDITQLEDKHSQLAQEFEYARQEKISLENIFNDLQNEYNKLVLSHNSLNTSYTSLKEEYEKFSEKYNEIYNSRYKEGYDDGYVQGFKATGYNIKDPTYEEAVDFIRSDKTDKKRYVEGNYTCLNFSADFKNNAFEAGYRCGFVYVEFEEGAHGIVCFNTTDKGLIFVEPQDDDIVKLVVGGYYWDHKVINYVIVW